MPSFEEPTNSEVYRMLTHLTVDTKEKFAELGASLKANSDATLQTLQQATKTNGRVNKIEDDFYGKDGYPGTRKEVHELRESFLFTKGAIWLGITLVTVVPAVIVAFASLWIKEQVRQANEEMFVRLEDLDEQIDTINNTFEAYDIKKE